jgi:hypothetical protein
MKAKRTKIPYRKDVVKFQSKPTKKDLEQMKDYAQRDQIQNLKDLVNERVASMEEGGYVPGLSTRDFLSSALSESIKERYPELKKMSEQEQAEFLRDRVYPGLDKLEESAGRKHRMRVEGYDRNEYDAETGDIVLEKDNPNLLATALHEMGHAVDENILGLNRLRRRKRFLEDAEKAKEEEIYARRSGGMEEFVKLNPKVKNLLDTEMTKTTSSEDQPLNPFKRSYKPIRRMPNFEDYNYETGEFESDILEDPIEKYKEVGGEHHINRPFSLENFINFSKGDLEDIVQADDRFKNLRKKLS